MAERIEFTNWLETHDQPFVVIDADFRIVAVNRAYEVAYHVRGEEVVGTPCYATSHHHDRPCFEHGEECPHRRIFEGRRQESCLHTHFDGEGRARWVRVTGHRLTTREGAVYLGEGLCEIASQEPAAVEKAGPRMVGRSPAFLAMVERLQRAAATASPVLIQGETGTGKELAASFIHAHSSRRDRPFICLDCTTLTESLFESEVFGHERGAFTGSVAARTGLFELADGGTLFLDEIGEMPLAMQAKLLRVLETHEFRRVGGDTVRRADVRVVCATNRSLWSCVRQGTFREDLYYRIACFTIHAPPLRERLEDIPLLAAELLRTLPPPAGGRRIRVTPEAIALLQQHTFPGNVRELRNLLQVAAATCGCDRIDAEAIEEVVSRFEAWRAPLDPHPAEAAPAAPPPAAGAAEPPSMAEVERRYIAELLERYHGHRRRVAQALGISERTLYRRLKAYGLR
ncbi:MAG: PAS domain-containing protein [Nitrospirae bacterium]|nr:MAG: PAS domain-containing protein [Nitrospirota bacterium]